MTLTLNGLRVATAKVRIPEVGAWIADLSVDLEDGEALPTAAATLVVPGGSFAGTVDPASSGTFGKEASVRLIGHKGGWWRALAALQHHNDAGVKLSQVISTVAAAVGEVVSVSADRVVGPDYVRPAGVASSVLQGEVWWTDPTGATFVGPRPALALPGGVQVLECDLNRNIATVFADAPILPGMTLVDEKLPGGSAKVVSVELDFAPDKARARCYLAAAGPSLATALRALTADPRAPFARLYQYRVVSSGAKRHDLQAVRKIAGVPDSVAIAAWPGVPGVDAELTPGAGVLVGFIDGEPGRPYVAAFEGPEGEGYRPVKLAFDATQEIRLGGILAKLVAHAEKVDANLTALQVKFDAHTHVVATTGTAAAQSGTAAAVIPVQAVGPLPSVAASKTLAE